MKRLFKIMLTLALCAVCVLGAVACDGGKDGDSKAGVQVTYSEKEGGYVLYSYTKEENVTELDLDAAVKAATKDANAKLVVIKEKAFRNVDSLTSIIVPNTVKTIEQGAFYNVKNLEELTLPFIGSKLKADAFPNQTIESADKAVDNEKTFAYIFGQDEYDGGSTVSVMSVTDDSELIYYLPVSLNVVKVEPAEDYNIPMYAFYGLSAELDIVFSEKVIGIGENAFGGCDKLVELDIPKSVLNIYKNAFNGCSALKVINYAGTKAEFEAIVKGEDWNASIYEYAKVKCADGDIDISSND